MRDACGLRAFHKHKDFAVSYAIFCEKLCISFRIDPYREAATSTFNKPVHGPEPDETVRVLIDARS